MSSHDIHTPRDVKIPRGLTTIFAMAIAGAIGLAVGSLHSRSSDAKALAKLTLDNAVPTVGLIADGDKHDAPKLVLPGTLQAYVSTPIHARVSGYLKSWSVDIGARVKAGQVLYEIEPDSYRVALASAQASVDRRAHLVVAGGRMPGCDHDAKLRQLLPARDGHAMGVTLLSSDMGKLYVALAQAIERLRR